MCSTGPEVPRQARARAGTTIAPSERWAVAKTEVTADKTTRGHTAHEVAAPRFLPHVAVLIAKSGRALQGGQGVASEGGEAGPGIGLADARAARERRAEGQRPACPPSPEMLAFGPPSVRHAVWHSAEKSAPAAFEPSASCAAACWTASPPLRHHRGLRQVHQASARPLWDRWAQQLCDCEIPHQTYCYMLASEWGVSRLLDHGGPAPLRHLPRQIAARTRTVRPWL